MRNRDKDKHELVEKAEAFEQLAIKRLEKIQTLEAQRRQYVYDVAKRRLAGGLPQATGAPLVVDALQVIKQPCSIFPSTHVLPSLSLSNPIPVPSLQAAETASEADDNVLLSDLLEERGGDLNPDENLLEVRVLLRSYQLRLSFSLLPRYS